MDLDVRLTDIEKRVDKMKDELGNTKSDVKLLIEKIDRLMDKIDYMVKSNEDKFVSKTECHNHLIKNEAFTNKLIGAILFGSFIVGLIIKFIK